jgi:hypothetical protein
MLVEQLMFLHVRCILICYENFLSWWWSHRHRLIAIKFFHFYRHSQSFTANNVASDIIHCVIVLFSQRVHKFQSWERRARFHPTLETAKEAADNKLGSALSTMMIIVRKASINCLIAICIALCILCQSCGGSSVMWSKMKRKKNFKR